MTEVCNMFWYGDLTDIQLASIKSFIAHGFAVNLWNYQDLQVEGATSRNANDIIPQEDLFKYSQLSTDGSEQKSLAVFSDLFRFSVLSKENGWWFDTDCICLKDQSYFKELRMGKAYICGIEEDDKPGSAVLFMSKGKATELLKYSLNLLNQYNNVLPEWGLIGPKAIAKFMEDRQPIDEFFAIHWNQSQLLLESEFFSDAMRETKKSSICHLWNSAGALNQYKPGSFLDNVIKNYR